MPLVTVLATIGVAVGVAVLMVVIAVMTGTQSELKKKILGLEAHALVQSYNRWIPDDDRLYRRIEAIPGVTNASPGIYTQGMVRSAAGISGIVLRGASPKRSGVQVGDLSGQAFERLLGSDAVGIGHYPLVLGSVLADKLKVKAGDDVMAMVAGKGNFGAQQLPKMHRLRVVGTFTTGMHQYDGRMGFMSIRSMQELLGVDSMVNGIELRVVDPADIKQVTGQVLAALGNDYWIYDWQQMNRNLFAMLLMQKLVMYVILTLIIIVAAFNIASALIMMVKEKTKDIAILKAMGAKRTALRCIFLVKGLIIGVVGIFLGVTGGALICWLLSGYEFIHLPGDIYFLTTLPVKVNAFDIAIIVLGTLFICLCASLYPSGKASRMETVSGIRYG